MGVYKNGVIRRMADTVAFGAGPNNAITEWRYVTNDDAAAIETAGHFNELAGRLQKGSLIYCSLDMDGTPTGRVYQVVSNAAGVVGVAKLVAAAGGGSEPPALQALTISSSSATVGTAGTWTVSGRTPGSTLALSGAGALGLAIDNDTGVISGAPTATGAVNVIETLGSATRTTNGLITVAAAGGTGPAAFVLPTPPFGADNLLAWWDPSKTYKDSGGVDQPSVFYDTVSSPTVTTMLDLAGLGYSVHEGDKSLQPDKGLKGGPMISGTQIMEFMRKDLLSGRQKVSLYWRLRPLNGTAARVILTASEANTNQDIRSIDAIVSGGTGYAVGDYITLAGGTGGAAQLVVDAVDGSGAVTAVHKGVAATYTVFPANPVGQASTSRQTDSGPVAGTGTGATFNLSFGLVGNGSNAERFTHYAGNNGTASRKPYVTVNPDDGSAVVAALATTSFGGPNNAGLTDTATWHTLGAEVDMVAGTVTYYYDGVADGVQTIPTGKLNISDSVAVYFGNSATGVRPGNFDFAGGLVIADIPDATRRAAIHTYLGAL